MRILAVRTVHVWRMLGRRVAMRLSIRSFEALVGMTGEDDGQPLLLRPLHFHPELLGEMKGAMGGTGQQSRTRMGQLK